MKMKILIYSLNFAPELTGIGKYNGEMARWLVRHGHEVRVVTAPPYYPEWRVRPGFSGARYRTERWEGVDVTRCPLWVPEQAGGLKRLLHLASFALSSLPVMVRRTLWRPDVVFVVEPALLCTPAALVVARLAGARSWLHIQDYEVDAGFAMGLLRGRRLRSLVLAVERWIMRRFDVVSTISGRMLELAAQKGVDPSRLTPFPNWVDVSGIVPIQAPSPYRKELGISRDAVVALCSGNMGNKQGLEVLAFAARILQSETGIQFVFCGDGAGKDAFVRQCEGLRNVRLLPLQPIERLSDLLGLADIHLLPQRADAADLVLPSKLTGMLASGRPVVVTAESGTELAQIMQKAGCGMSVPPEHPEELAAAIRMLARDPKRRTAMGIAAREYAKLELDLDRTMSRFAARLQALAQDIQEGRAAGAWPSAMAARGHGAAKVMYRGPNGETWSGGRGHEPQWVVEALREGKSLEDFAVSSGPK